MRTISAILLLTFAGLAHAQDAPTCIPGKYIATVQPGLVLVWSSPSAAVLAFEGVVMAAKGSCGERVEQPRNQRHKTAAKYYAVEYCRDSHRLSLAVAQGGGN